MAIAAGYSRIYLGQHFLTDVLFGALLGTFISVLTIFVSNKVAYRKPLRIKVVQKVQWVQYVQKVGSFFQLLASFSYKKTSCLRFVFPCLLTFEPLWLCDKKNAVSISLSCLKFPQCQKIILQVFSLYLLYTLGYRFNKILIIDSGSLSCICFQRQTPNYKP